MFRWLSYVLLSPGSKANVHRSPPQSARKQYHPRVQPGVNDEIKLVLFGHIRNSFFEEL